MTGIQKMYYVTSKALGAAMQGSKSANTGRGSIYGVFATEAKADAFIEKNKMGLYAVVVPQ